MVAYKLPPLHAIPDTPFYQQPSFSVQPATSAQQPNYSSLSPEVMQAFCQAQNSLDLVRAFNNHAGVDQSVPSFVGNNNQLHFQSNIFATKAPDFNDMIHAIKTREQELCQSIFNDFLHSTRVNQQSPTSVTDFRPPALANTLPAYDPGTLISDMQHLMAQYKSQSLSMGSFDTPQSPVENSTQLAYMLQNPAFNGNLMSPQALESPTMAKDTDISSPSSCNSSVDQEDNDKRPHQCHGCGKRFRFKSNLFEHKSLHLKAHPFQCPFCGKTCRLKGNLKKHLQIHVNTVEDLEKLWKERFSRSSGRPRKNAPPMPLPSLGDDLGLVPINKGNYVPKSDLIASQSLTWTFGAGKSPIQNNATPVADVFAQLLPEALLNSSNNSSKESTEEPEDDEIISVASPKPTTLEELLQQTSNRSSFSTQIET
ncbi:gastrula zinc finger protein XlCGF67.1 [Ditylenchus destructor]|nr:gastrula zinc finger protein XlCGF67.1 [Ditylenchus destructor]